MKALYAGSFDPITTGHMELIQEAAELFDLTVGVANNPKKKHWLPENIRLELVKNSIGFESLNCEVKIIEGLVADFCFNNQIRVLVRGLRNTIDFEYETSMAHANRIISKDKLSTVFIPTSQTQSHVSSSVVRELYSWRNESAFVWVPYPVHEYLSENRHTEIIWKEE